MNLFLESFDDKARRYHHHSTPLPPTSITHLNLASIWTYFLTFQSSTILSYTIGHVTRSFILMPVITWVRIASPPASKTRSLIVHRILDEGKLWVHNTRSPDVFSMIFTIFQPLLGVGSGMKILPHVLVYLSMKFGAVKKLWFSFAENHHVWRRLVAKKLTLCF